MTHEKERGHSKIVALEKSVKKEFGKEFDLERSRGRAPWIADFWSRFDLDGKICLDVGAGHPVVPAVLTSVHPGVRFDCVDISPDFETEAGICIEGLKGDPSRFRLVTSDFYDIADLARRGRLANRYDFVLVTETLHHSLRKAYFLSILTKVMDDKSLMVLVEPVLPVLGTKAAYGQSQWARDQGYIEEPVTMKEYRRAFKDAGLEVIAMEYDGSREYALGSWKRKLLPGPLYRFYRQRVRPLWAATSFVFVCRLPGDRQ